MNRQDHDRLLLPLLLPTGVIASVLLVIFLGSRILLEVPNEVATPLALLAALAILGVSTYLATHPGVPGWQLNTIIGLPVALLVAGGLFAIVHTQGEGATEPPVRVTLTPGVAPPPSEVSLRIEMGDNFFEGDVQNGGTPGAETTITIPAGTLRIEAVNVGVVPHNVHIYKSKGGDSIAATEPLIIQGGTTGTLEATLVPGTYYYQCDFHPTEMIGTLTITGG